MHEDNPPPQLASNAKETLEALHRSSASPYTKEALAAQSHSNMSGSPGLVVGLPADPRRWVDGSDDTRLRKEDDLQRGRDEVGKAAVHSDPAFVRTGYRDVVQGGLQRGIFRVGLRRRQGAKLVFRHQKGRASEAHRGPQAQQPTLPFATGSETLFGCAGFCEVYAAVGAAVWSLGVDAKAWVSELFALEPLQAGELGLETVDGVSVVPRRRVYPQQLVPMGWTWALTWQHTTASWTEALFYSRASAPWISSPTLFKGWFTRCMPWL